MTGGGGRGHLARIAWVLPKPDLGGGTQVVFRHAEIAREAGHRVSILGEGGAPSWLPAGIPWIDRTSGPGPLPPQDLVIATWFETVEPALALRLGPVVHFCQGYEGNFSWLADRRSEIERLYALPIPALVVAPHLGELLAHRFGKTTWLAPAPLSPLFRPGRLPRLGPRPRPRVLVPGIFESPVKDVPTALRALLRLRAGGIPARSIRVSLFPLSETERKLVEPDLYLHSVRPEVVAATLRDADLVLFPSLAEEGFGLPLLEAMGSGIPAVATRIPGVEWMTGGAVPLVPPGDVEAMAAAATRLLRDAGEWRRVRSAGRAASARFEPRHVRGAVLQALDHAAREAAVMQP